MKIKLLLLLFLTSCSQSEVIKQILNRAQFTKTCFYVEEPQEYVGKYCIEKVNNE